MSSYSATFFFNESDMRIKRATARATIGIAVAVATETKRVTHRLTGNLMRSVHAAPAGYDGSGDEAEAARGDMLDFALEPTLTPFGPMVEVGSWMPYACVEWIGRGHPGIDQGLEAVRGIRASAIVHQAFREEGLVN